MTEEPRKIKTALISVYHKDGLEEFSPYCIKTTYSFSRQEVLNHL